MQDIYKNIEEHNLDRKRKALLVFDEFISNKNMICNKKVNQIVTELFIGEKKLNISNL